jgi:hypothetical protein
VDDLAISYSPVVGIPGECAAMFEIMHRICRSIGCPFNHELWLLNHHLLVPLIAAARETRALLRTEGEYFPFDKFGQLIIPDYFADEFPETVAAPAARR